MKAQTWKTLRFFLVLNIFAALFGFALWYGGSWKNAVVLGVAAGWWYVGAIFGFILGTSSRYTPIDLEEKLLKEQGFTINCPRCTNFLNDHPKNPKPVVSSPPGDLRIYDYKCGTCGMTSRWSFDLAPVPMRIADVTKSL